jgi:hypothetical protein
LTVTIDPSSISEHGGQATGTVTRQASGPNALIVDLACDDATEVTLPSQVTIAANELSATFTIAAMDDSSIDGTQVVTVTAAAADFQEGTATLQVTDDDGTGVVDDGDSGYSETGTNWGGSTNVTTYDVYGNDIRWHNTGVGSNTANWTFTNLPAGRYRVSATWLAHTNRATNAPYTVYDGTTSEGTIRLNQQQIPTVTRDGWQWEDLGIYDIDSGQLRVELSDDANGFVIADAVRIEHVSSSGAALAVASDPAAMSEDGGPAAGMVTRQASSPNTLIADILSDDVVVRAMLSWFDGNDGFNAKRITAVGTGPQTFTGGHAVEEPTGASSVPPAVTRSEAAVIEEDVADERGRDAREVDSVSRFRAVDITLSETEDWLRL